MSDDVPEQPQVQPQAAPAPAPAPDAATPAPSPQPAEPQLPPVVAPIVAAEATQPEASPEPEHSAAVTAQLAPDRAWAVLTAPRGDLVVGQVVFGPAVDIAALVTSEDAVDASPVTVEAAFPFHHPLPEG